VYRKSRSESSRHGSRHFQPADSIVWYYCSIDNESRIKLDCAGDYKEWNGKQTLQSLAKDDKQRERDAEATPKL
jgi:hypothetical protein